MKRTILILLLCTSSLIAQPKHWTKVDSVFSPFGVSAESFSSLDFCDIDADGDPDLFVGSLGGDELAAYRNKGTAANPLFRHDTTILASLFAGSSVGFNHEYPCLVDIDGDFDFDLVVGGFSGLDLYINIGTREACVWKRDTVLFAAINTVIGNDPKPTLADLDADGDPDLLIGIGESLLGGPTAGITLGYRNLGTPTVPAFSADNALVTGIPDVGLNAYPTLRDLDNDGDFDLMMGRDLQTMLYYQNSGSVFTPAWTATASVVSTIETKLYWKTPVLCDLDGDTDQDLIYGSADGTIIGYLNLGSPAVPVFVQQPNWFTMVRIEGSVSTVSFADFDGDGDQDLMSGDWLGGLQYFRNEGTKTKPVFKKMSTGFTSIDAGSYTSPVFIDIDKDGDLDVVTGNMSGTLSGYVNTGGVFALEPSYFSGIDVGWRSAPAFVDIDKDGDLDMLVGAEDPALCVFYRNNGSNLFTIDSALANGITFVRDTHPYFTDLDGDGDYDLVMGSGWGEVVCYTNVGTPQEASWEPDDDLFEGIATSQSATPGFADLDGDGIAELVMGDYNGNFTYYKRNKTTEVKDQRNAAIPFSAELYQNYPNPFNPSTVISYQLVRPGIVTLTITDVLGRTVAMPIQEHQAAGMHRVSFNASRLSSGTYFCVLRAGTSMLTRKMVLAR